ncbi:hypothetical protein [Streptomyces sp. STR69]|uniref:hypothetical protein n=1 Tax=Streptomyces sp. STR69 TaxID=1796942 RepID=UPI0021C9ED51|nr:hypothetical protein [Streptomyces sp. STR69]
MSRQHETSGGTPPGSEDTAPVAVRRAVQVSAVAGDPGAALTPSGRAATVPVRPEATPEQQRPQAPERSAWQPGPEAQAAAPELAAAPAGSTAREEPAAPEARAGADVLAEHEADEAPAGTSGADTEGVRMPSAGPKKPVLAAAAIIGALLIGVPFLVLGHGDSKPSHPAGAAATSDTVLNGRPDGAAGGYVSGSPSATPSSKQDDDTKTKKKTTKSPPTPAAKQQTTAAKAKSAETGGHVASTGSGTTKTQSSKTTKTTITAPAGTAAYAVQKLAAASPGRHICYRAYVSDVGWQAPVCDGAQAGTVGQARAIEALNIAVSGVSGTGSNGYIENSGWEPNWKFADNGANLTIGTTGQLLRMEAFTLNVGSGTVCANAHVENIGWQGRKCDTPGDFLTAGTTGLALRLEAVELTV